MTRPLDGMLVLDLGQIYNGPYCGLLLGFMGARVLKIESPEGDIVRRRKRQVEPYPAGDAELQQGVRRPRPQARRRQGAVPSPGSTGRRASSRTSPSA